MMVTRIISWILRKSGIGNVAVMKDMTNAFQCTLDAYRQTALHELYLPCHVNFLQQRLAWAAIRMEGYDGVIHALPGAGNQIGSCEGPLLFCLPYRDALADWR